MSRRRDLVDDVALLEAFRPIVAELVDEELAHREAWRRVEWLTVEEAAVQRRTTPGAMRARCERGQVLGAVKDGRRWLVPSLEAQLEPGYPAPRQQQTGRAPR